MLRGRKPYPLDLASHGDSSVERPNRALLQLFERHVLAERPAPAVLDVSSGAGANAREIRRLASDSTIVGIEPNAEAARLARTTADEVFEGTLERWLEARIDRRFDAVLLANVIEHVADPLALLRRLNDHPGTRVAAWLVSVPNYAVWYNRLRTLAGTFSYSWSGLYDRAHLRFFTRSSIRQLLERAGRSVSHEGSTPSLVQAVAPLLRLPFEAGVDSERKLAPAESAAFRAYERFVEPFETRVCRVWPELFGYELVCLCRAR